MEIANTLLCIFVVLALIIVAILSNILFPFWRALRLFTVKNLLPQNQFRNKYLPTPLDKMHLISRMKGEMSKPIAKQHALLLGIDTYQQFKPLFFPNRDVFLLDSALQAHNFGVKSWLNETSAQSEDANKTHKNVVQEIEKFVYMLANMKGENNEKVYANALFYFSGHAICENDEVYLICHDTDKNNIKETSISYSKLRGIFSKLQNAHVIIILDCPNTEKLVKNVMSAPSHALVNSILADAAWNVELLVSGRKELVQDTSPFAEGLIRVLIGDLYEYSPMGNHTDMYQSFASLCNQLIACMSAETGIVAPKYTYLNPKGGSFVLCNARMGKSHGVATMRELLATLPKNMIGLCHPHLFRADLKMLALEQLRNSPMPFDKFIGRMGLHTHATELPKPPKFFEKGLCYLFFWWNRFNQNLIWQFICDQYEQYDTLPDQLWRWRGFLKKYYPIIRDSVSYMITKDDFVANVNKFSFEDTTLLPISNVSSRDTKASLAAKVHFAKNVLSQPWTPSELNQLQNELNTMFNE